MSFRTIARKLIRVLSSVEVLSLSFEMTEVLIIVKSITYTAHKPLYQQYQLTQH